MYRRRRWATDFAFLLRQHNNSCFLSARINILNIFKIIFVVSLGILSASDDLVSPIFVTRRLRSLPIPTAISTCIPRIRVETFVRQIASVFRRPPSAGIRLWRFELISAPNRCRWILPGAAVTTRVTIVASCTSEKEILLHNFPWNHYRITKINLNHKCKLNKNF